MAAQYWCFDGSSWRLIDDPLPPEGSFAWDSLFELHGKAGFELLFGPGEGDGHCISLWHRDSKPECLIYISGGADHGLATVYADRLPDGIDLFARWATATYAHGGEPEPST